MKEKEEKATSKKENEHYKSQKKGKNERESDREKR